MSNDSYTLATVVAALKNSGIDTECGACMEVAFTGVTTNDHTCHRGVGDRILVGYHDDQPLSEAGSPTQSASAKEIHQSIPLSVQQQQAKEITQALRVIRKGLSEGADGEFWSARRWLDDRGVFHGDLSGYRVLELVAKEALSCDEGVIRREQKEEKDDQSRFVPPESQSKV